MNLKRCQVLKISCKPSRRGGYFYYYFMKELEVDKSCRCCTSSEFRNFGNWKPVKIGDILEGLYTFGTYRVVDADSNFVIVRNG